VYKIILIYILTILTWYNLYYRHAATTPNWYSEINVTFYNVTLARTIWLPDDGLRTETCRNVFNVLMCKFYICAVVGLIIEWLHNMDGVTTEINKNMKTVSVSQRLLLMFYRVTKPLQRTKIQVSHGWMCTCYVHIILTDKHSLAISVGTAQGTNIPIHR